jgi:hypothetical protein
VGHDSSDEAPKLTLKERAKKARHEAYLAAKERRKSDPRTAELKARAKAARREASAQAKERRKTDPKQLALREKLKKDRRDASEQRKSRTGATETTERSIASEPTLALIQGDAVGDRTRSLALARAALTVIEGGKSTKIHKG